jgi:glycosyltransferase involved in cell wall biosynthesis
VESKSFRLGVVVPSYNHAKFLPITLLSLLNQSHSNLQIVVIDDCSSDNTQEVLLGFRNEPRIRVVTNNSNLGESESVNIGWQALQTEFIAIVSADDPQNLDWAEEIMKFISSNPGYVGYYPNLQIINDSGVVTKIVKLRNWNSREARERLICIASAGTVFNRTLLPSDFRPRISGVLYPSDLIQLLNIANYGDLKRVDGVLGVWRESANGLTATLSGATKAQELYKSISSWIAENANTNSEVNTDRMKVNLYGQMWKLYRKDFSFNEALSQIQRYVKFTYFLSPRNLLNIIRAIWQYYFLKSV